MKSLQTIGGPVETALVACRVFEPELTSLGVSPQRVTYLDQGLHRYPDDLRRELTAVLRSIELESSVRRVILAYGYCGGGLEGLTAERVELVFPPAHDCVSLLLGRETVTPAGGSEGIFYLSPGWIDHGQTPYTEYFAQREKFGHEDALWIGQRMLAGYREVVLVETGAGILPHHRRYAREMAELFGLGYREVRGCRGRLRLLLGGNACRGVMMVPPGRPIERRRYPGTEEAR